MKKSTYNILIKNHKTMRVGCENILKSIEEGKEINTAKTIRALLKTVVSLSNSIDELLYELEYELEDDDDTCEVKNPINDAFDFLKGIFGNQKN
jgi:hypothetical protein